jgi:hypothetical protein
VYRKIETNLTPPSTGIRFLRSQAGYLFLNLLVADSTQALGFGLAWIWARHGRIEPNTHVCIFQAVAIQAGDVASAVFSLFIAVHTAALLTLGRQPSKFALRLACGTAWIFTALLAGMGPMAIANKSDGNFYGEAGNWCWISAPYHEQRLWLHYLLVSLVFRNFDQECRADLTLMLTGVAIHLCWMPATGLCVYLRCRFHFSLSEPSRVKAE